MNIGIIYGGVSCEHDISIISGLQAIHNINKIHNVYPLYIFGNKIYSSQKKSFKTLQAYLGKQNFMNEIVFINKGIKFKFPYKKVQLDCVVCALHGGQGEGGIIQSLLEFYNIPYTSTCPKVSAVCLDKALAKSMLDKIGILCVKDYIAKINKYNLSKAEMIEDIELHLDYPIIIKPAVLGSSIGISIAENKKELEEGLKYSFGFDKKLVVEKKIYPMREFNCACIVKDNKITISDVEEPISKDKILSFEDKYYNNGKMSDASREFPAKISSSLKDRISHMVEKIAIEFELKGVVRIDFIYDESVDNLYVNEINNIPGSLSFYLFENQNLSFTKILDILIEEGIKIFNKENQFIKGFKSSVLSQKNNQGNKLTIK